MRFDIISTDKSLVQTLKTTAEYSVSGVFESITEYKEEVTNQSSDDIVVVAVSGLTVDAVVSSFKSSGIRVFFVSETASDYYAAQKVRAEGFILRALPNGLSPNRVSDYITMDHTEQVAERDTNVIVFFGVSGGVGTSMLASTFARYLAQDQSARIAYLTLDGTVGGEYLTATKSPSLEGIKTSLLNNLLTYEEFLEVCSMPQANLIVFNGSDKLPFLTQYKPNHIEFLLTTISNHFDVVIVDVGSNFRLGMYLGAIGYTKHRVLVTDTSKVHKSRFENLEAQILAHFGIKSYLTLTNKYVSLEQVPPKQQIQKELGGQFGGVVDEIPEFGLCSYTNTTPLDLPNLKSNTLDYLGVLLKYTNESLGKSIKPEIVKKGFFKKFFGNK